MEISEIKQKMKPGDLESAANIVGISPNNASQVLKRVNSKRHEKLKSVLEKVIEMREQILSELK
ncbi:hypothetical protein [Pelobium manganitolerans]|uniref:hypothetical protein n=1 Tax=Pelobium manganitolerans TaxID=1842495 RepID=UPI003FA3B6F9